MVKREMSEEEREIRNGMVDILCFLASGRATKEEIQKLKVRVDEAVRDFQKDEAAERVA